MAITNFDTKEINCKIVYFGPESSGKTENMRSLYKCTAEEMKSGLMEFKDSTVPTKYFEFLPISLGYVKEFHIKLHLFSLPKLNLFETVIPVLLKGVDGAIFVADSQIERMAANVECYEQIEKTFDNEGYDLKSLPMVVQYNKRDINEVMPLEVLQDELNPRGLPEQEAIASQSVGTLETLHCMAKMVLIKLAPT